MPRKLAEAILDHAYEGFPLEVCGILGGKDGAASTLYRMTNIDQSHVHFMMDPREQFKVMKEMRIDGLELLAVYHSHTESPARPSAEDIRLALTPDISNLIVSLQEANNPVLKSFRISAGRAEPEDLEFI